MPEHKGTRGKVAALSRLKRQEVERLSVAAVLASTHAETKLLGGGRSNERRSSKQIADRVLRDNQFLDRSCRLIGSIVGGLS